MHTALNVKKIGVVVFTCLILVAVMTSISQSQGDAKTMKNAVPSSKESIEVGQKSFQTSCAPCHGATGKGDGAVAKNLPTKPSDLTDAKWDHGSTDGEIFVNIRDGITGTPMKSQKTKLPADNDIWNVVNYIRSIGPKK